MIINTERKENVPKPVGLPTVGEEFLSGRTERNVHFSVELQYEDSANLILEYPLG